LRVFWTEWEAFKRVRGGRPNGKIISIEWLILCGRVFVKDLKPEVCERELSVRPNQKLEKNQWWPKQFGLEVFSFGSCPKYIGTGEELIDCGPTRSKAGLGRRF